MNTVIVQRRQKAVCDICDMLRKEGWGEDDKYRYRYIEYVDDMKMCRKWLYHISL